jgi:calcineurin-like phosphoesterase family protein
MKKMIDCLYDCFKHWAANGSVGILSDPHFCDADCKTMDRNWIDPDEHVAMINKKWHKNDTLILLGDLGDPEYVKQIKAKKVLITGNHDTPHLYREIIPEIYEGVLAIAPKIFLSHEPVLGLIFVVNIHGHDHAGKHRYYDEAGAKHINVASNVCGWMPINLGEEIKKGLFSKIPDIHRVTIDYATKNSIKKKNREQRKREGEFVAGSVRGAKNVKPVERKLKTEPVAQPKDPNKRINKLRERYCCNCTNTDVKDHDALMRRECPLYARKCVVVVNTKLKHPIRYTISVDGESHIDKARNESYQSHEKIDGDKFIYCESCPEMVAVISSMSKPKREPT